MLRQIALILALASTLHVAGADDAVAPNTFDPKMRVVFTAEQIEAEADASKIPTPRGVWTPAESDIERLETLMLPRLTEAIAAEGPTGSKQLLPADYYRQYLGHTTGSQRMITVSGLYRPFVELAMQRESDPEIWKRKFMMSTDFGCRYFKARFNVDAGTLELKCAVNIFKQDKSTTPKPETPTP